MESEPSPFKNRRDAAPGDAKAFTWVARKDRPPSYLFELAVLKRLLVVVRILS
jgi:hypothetical protein